MKGSLGEFEALCKPKPGLGLHKYQYTVHSNSSKSLEWKLKAVIFNFLYKTKPTKCYVRWWHTHVYLTSSKMSTQMIALNTAASHRSGIRAGGCLLPECESTERRSYEKRLYSQVTQMNQSVYYNISLFINVVMSLTFTWTFLQLRQK